MDDHPETNIVVWNGRKPKPGEYSRLPKSTVRPGWQHPNKGKRMTLEEAGLWNILLSYDYGGGQIYVSDQTLAEDAGLSDRQVRRIRNALKQKGFLTWEPYSEDKRKNSFTLYAPHKLPQTNQKKRKSRTDMSGISRTHLSDQEEEKRKSKRPPRVTPATKLLDAFSHSYFAKLHTEYINERTRDINAARDLLKEYPDTKVIYTALDLYFRDDTLARYTGLPSFAQFCYHVSTYAKDHYQDINYNVLPLEAKRPAR